MTVAHAPHTTGLWVSTMQVARRTFLKFIRTPQLVVVGTTQGVLFLLIFRYVFGGAIGGGGIGYVDFLVPGFITTGIIFIGAMASAGVAEDLEQGFVDRLRSLPIPRSAVLAGRSLADTAMVGWSLAVVTAVGFAAGFRLHAPVGKGILAFLLLLVFAFAFEWIFILLGLYAGNAQAAQGMSLMIVPFVFVSSAFVPVETMPKGLRAVANHQPVTFMVDAVRALTQGAPVEHTLGHTAGYFVVRALLWSVALVAVFAPIAIRRYRRV